MKNLKTTKFSAAFIILAGIIVNCFALPVDVETAKSAGQAFRANNNPMTIRNLRTLPDLTLVYTAGNAQTSIRTAQTPLFYVFNADNGGFVIVSGDNAVEPVLAYSNENLFDAQEINPALLYWLDGYEKQIKYLRENELSASDEIAEKWNNLLSGKSIRANDGGKGPLVSAKWDQSPYYNDSCPSRSVVGCVAVAMGQIMNYWKYPLKGNGYYSYASNYGTLSVDFQSAIYNWSIIPDSLVERMNADAINPTPAQRELAKLLYHLGVSVEMDYSPEESGAYVYFRPGYRYPTNHSSQTALSTFFGYDDSMRGIARSGYSDVQWLSVIKKEIDEGRPIIYSGTDRISDGDHAFVCDGYDGSNRLHINWGWGGVGDGYFSANNFTFSLYGTSFNFIDDQDILIGIAPPQKHQPFDIRLDKVETTNDAIFYGDQILLDARVSNRGSNIFRGNFCAIFSNDVGENVDFAVIYDTLISANDNAILNFSIFSLPYLQAGEYNVDFYYAVSGGNWLKFSDLSQSEQVKITVKENESYETPVINRQTVKKYGILVEKAIVSETEETMEIKVITPVNAQTNIIIYDNLGNAMFEANGKTDNFVWDLKNKAGKNVANGSYLIIAEAKDVSGKVYRYQAKVGVRR